MHRGTSSFLITYCGKTQINSLLLLFIFRYLLHPDTQLIVIDFAITKALENKQMFSRYFLKILRYLYELLLPCDI